MKTEGRRRGEEVVDYEATEGNQRLMGTKGYRRVALNPRYLP